MKRFLDVMFVINLVFILTFIVASQFIAFPFGSSTLVYCRIQYSSSGSNFFTSQYCTPEKSKVIEKEINGNSYKVDIIPIPLESNSLNPSPLSNIIGLQDDFFGRTVCIKTFERHPDKFFSSLFKKSYYLIKSEGKDNVSFAVEFEAEGISLFDIRDFSKPFDENKCVQINEKAVRELMEKENLKDFKFPARFIHKPTSPSNIDKLRLEIFITSKLTNGWRTLIPFYIAIFLFIFSFINGAFSFFKNIWSLNDKMDNAAKGPLKSL